MAAILLAVGLALAAGAAEPKSDFSAKQIRKLTDDYAGCIVKRRPAQAAEALLRNVDNDTIMRDYGRLIDGGCVTRPAGGTLKMAFSGDLYRYALADALVQRELVALPAPDLAAVPPLDQRALPPAPPALDPQAGEAAKKKQDEALAAHAEQAMAVYLARYGECVVRTDTSGARALLAAKPGGPEEGIAFTTLRPALARCVPEAQTLSFGKMVLRGAIAVNYYRLARAAGVVPGKSGR